MLAALAMLGPFSIDGYLPAFPDIERSLSASPIEVQQTLTAYLFSFAIMILWHGALSDSLGRRNIILASLAVFVVASSVAPRPTRLATCGAFACCRGSARVPVWWSGAP